jgi:MoaA/NifB/PqqE/SkfB family radical SAM enzyme
MSRLLGDTAALHDSVAGRAGDFDRTLAEVRAARDRGEPPALSIGLTRRNFHVLDPMVALACRETGTAPPDVGEPYDVRPVGKVHANLVRRLKALAPFQYRSGIEIEFVDPDLAAILRGVERVVGPTNEGDMLRALGMLAGTVFVGPKRLLVDPLYACNLDCVYCNNFSAPRKNATRLHRPAADDDPRVAGRGKVLDWATYETAVREARAMGVEALSLVGGGEPLLHPRFADMLDLATALGFQVDTSTNGIALTGEIARRIVRAAPDSMTVSLSAATDATFRVLHPDQPPGTYARAMENVRRLADLRGAAGSARPNLIALYVVCNANFREAEAMVRAAKDAGFDEVWFQLVHVRDFCKGLALSAEEIPACRAAIARAKGLAASLGVRFSDYISFQLDHVRPDGTWSAGSFVERGCLVGWTFSLLACGGEVSFCCGWKFVGPVEGGGFRTVWESARYGELREAALRLGRGDNPVLDNGKRLFDEFCLSCDNHNLNREAFDLLEKADLLKYLGGPLVQ